VDVFFVSLCACYVSAHPSHQYFLAGAEGGEEEVDIDDDLAPSQFAPVVIDKDRGAETGGSKSSSSDGDSSDSGSSSSGKMDLPSTMTPAVVNCFDENSFSAMYAGANHHQFLPTVVTNFLMHYYMPQNDIS
jgi:hypothetical protein